MGCSMEPRAVIFWVRKYVLIVIYDQIMPTNRVKNTSRAGTWRVQSIYFLTPGWNATSARAWLVNNDVVPLKRMHRIGREMRYRIRDPNEFTRFRTRISPDGVHIVLGFKPS
jgi:hypothetical protein